MSYGPRNTVFKRYEKVWKTKEFMVRGLKELWDRRPHAHLKNGIMVSDAHMGHITEKVKTLTLNRDVLIIPQATLLSNRFLMY